MVDPEHSGRPGTYQVRALDRGLDILESFTLASPELTVTQISERAGLPKPTVVRLLSVLTARGYIEQVDGGEKHRLGVRTLEVGSNFLLSTSLQAEARPIMRLLADRTRQTANLGILDGYQVVHTEVVAPDRPVRFWASIGKREDAHISGLGKVLLTSLLGDEIETFLCQPRSALTPNSITRAEDLRAELEAVAARGYAIDKEESNLGVMCIAAPIYGGTGRIEAAVSISGLRAEIEANGSLQHCIEHVCAAAEKISIRLGWAGAVSSRALELVSHEDAEP